MSRFITRFLTLLVLSSIAVSLGLWLYADSPQLRWRLDAIHLKTLGALPDESWSVFIQRLRPGALDNASRVPIGIEDLQVVSVLDSDRDLERGAQLFQSQCAQCHPDGGGPIGPDLANVSSRTRFNDSEIYRAISGGVEGTSMPPFHGTATETLQLTAYIDNLVDTTTITEGQAAAAGPACPTCESVDVSYEDLLNATRSSDEWLTYSGSYTGQRFSALQQINHETINRLRPRWVYQMRSLEPLRSHPIVADGVMFLTGAANEVIALHAGTGELLWVFRRPIPDNLSLCCGRSSRGVTVLGKRVFHATIDGRLIALDAANGQPVWDVEVADPAAGYSSTGAPLAVKDKIIVGIAGGDYGARGFVDAYDAETGKRAWRFYTVPGPGEAGHETWENDAWKTGGGATWVTGSFDPELNLIYWGVGNPAPTHDGDYRPGDNLYTCSVIALDLDTGELKWHFQFSPNDTNDWDAAAVPVLADLEYAGKVRKLMLWANRNCFYYILDRETGRFLQATEYCEQNWNDGFSSEGRPIRRPNTRPTAGGVHIIPSPYGGSNWMSPAYSSRTGSFYVPQLRLNRIVRQSDEEFSPGRQFNGGDARNVPGPEGSTVSALDAVTGKVVWKKDFEDYGATGILVTAGDLVFVASESGVFFALDSRTGEEIWEMRLGGRIVMGPITYLHEGRQQLALIAVGSLFVLDLAGEPERARTSPVQFGPGLLTLTTDGSGAAE